MRWTRAIGISLMATALAVVAVAQQTEQIRERGGENDALKDSWEGKAPPPMEFEGWLYTEPLSWEKLEGKVVLLDFWAFW